LQEGKKISFTARGIGSIITPGYHADPESKGLYIQVFKGVSDYKRSWIFRYTSPTLLKRREMGLGSLDARSLADARKAIEVFASGVGIPIKSGYGITVVSYARMKCCPVSVRMNNAGGPFLLEGFIVLRHPSL